MKKLGIVFASVTLSLLFAVSPLASVSADSFNQNRIIDDAVFDKVSAMVPSQIDSFLNTFPGSCISPNSGFKASDPIGYNPTQGYSYGGFVTAGQVIYDAAQAYGLNPQVLITTLEKEQSLVSGRNNFAGYCNNGDQHKYAATVGYGCPDSGTTYSYTGLSLYQRNGVTISDTGITCVNSASKAGFSQQIIRAAWLFKFGEQRSKGNIGWAVIKGNWNNSDDPQTCYGGPMTQGTYQRCPSGGSAYYDGYTTIDNTAVHIESGGTAALYWYTPHFHGNQNFYSLFTGWFGTTSSRFGNKPSSQSSYSASSCNISNYDPTYVGRLYQPDSEDYFYTTNSIEACAAIKLGYIWDGLVMQSATGQNAVPVYRFANQYRHLFTSSASVRASYINSGFRDEGIAFYAYNSPVANSLPVYDLTDGITDLLTSAGAEGEYFMNAYGYTSSGIAFYTPAINHAHQSVFRLSRNTGERFYTIDQGEATAAQQYGFHGEGTASVNDIYPDVSNLPVYRLVDRTGHFYTTSRLERDLAVINYGYLSEGIGFYAPSSSYPSITPVNRLTNYRYGLRFYTANTTETQDASRLYGYVPEDIGWYSYGPN